MGFERDPRDYYNDLPGKIAPLDGSVVIDKFLDTFLGYFDFVHSETKF